MVVDRGQYQDAVTPWEDAAWREAALGWVRQELAARGMRPSGQWSVRLRPWSVLVRLPVEGVGDVWFKANPPASAFEAGLGEALARWVPEHVLQPLAVHAGRGWALLPDGGVLFRDALDRGDVDVRAWEEALPRYAALQRTLTPAAVAGEIEALGVPSGRTAELPAVFDRLVEANAVLSDDERTALRALRPRLAAWCEELAALGIADSLDHSDLHDAQVFLPGPGRFTFCDWGDAAVAHPFASLLVTARVARERFGPEVLPRLRDAYLEPWTGNGTTAAQLRRAVTLACRLGALGRASSWGRFFPDPHSEPSTEGADAAAYWLREAFTEEPVYR